MKKKKILLGLLLATSVFTITSCGKKDSGERGNPVGQSSEVIASSEKQKIQNEITLTVSDKDYDGNPIEVTVSSLSGETPIIEYKLADESDSSFTRTAPINAGNYIIKASLAESDNYYSTTLTKTFNINKLDSELSINIENKDYDGKAISASFSYTSDELTTYDVFYKISGEDDNTYTENAPTNAGNYIIKVTASSKNYKTVTETKAFTINKIKNEITLTVSNKLFDDNIPDLNAKALSNDTPIIECKSINESDDSYKNIDNITSWDYGTYIARAYVNNPNYLDTFATKTFKIHEKYINSNYSSLEGTSAYAKVTTAAEFFQALKNAQYDYTNNMTEITVNDGYIVRNNVRKNSSNWIAAITKGLYLKNNDDTYTKIPSDTPWDENDEVYTKDLTYYEDSNYSTVSYTQTLNKAGSIKVIEIAADLDLGYNKINSVSQGLVENWDKNKRLAGNTDIYCDSDIQEAGISKINVSRCNGLVIYSKCGAKLTHCGFNVSSSKDVTFDNIEMDEIWMWEDSTTTSPTVKIGDYDAFGWAYFKIAFSDNILIKNCSFGKSFDGQIDYSNPFFSSIGTYSSAPYGNTKGYSDIGLIVKNCDFNSGSDDTEGYIYKMMNKIENEYQVYLSDKTNYTYTKNSCRYYFALRDLGLTFDDVFYGIAIPQKKAFLWGDSGDSYLYNKYLVGIIEGCRIKNIEDRLPKVRGGIAYVYNTLVDNTEYLPYVPKLKSINISSVNSKYKLGGVSQGILSGLDASVYLDSVEYKGISSYIKNNDSLPDDNSTKRYPTVNGGYMIKNSIIGGIKGSTDKETNTDPFSSLNASSGTLSISNFNFKVAGEKIDSIDVPFNTSDLGFDAYDLSTHDSLDGYFENTHSGTY